DDDRVAALAWAERLSAALPTEPGELNRAQVDLAELSLRAGRPDDVLALLTPAFLGARIPRPEPLALAAAAPLIQAAQTAGRPGPARRAMAVADRLLPADRRMELPWPVLRARQERMEGRPEQAALMFGDLASGNPALAAAFAPDRARAEIQAGRPAEGLALLRAAWPAIGPSHRAAVLDDYAEAGAAAGWPGDALDWLERRAKDLPSAQGALLSARALLSAERPEGAAARVEELLRDPDAGPQAWLITAAARAWGGGRGLAAATLREGLDLHPRSEALWLALARLETGERRREALTSGAAADPVSAPLRAALAHAQFDLGAPGAAAASFAEAFALAPGSARDRAAASVALVDSGGKLDLALAHARFARAADPDSAWGADALGQALLALGDVDAAEPELRLAVERAGVRDLAAHLHLARLLAARGEAGPASRAALRALGGRLAAHQQTEAESLLRLAESANRVETTLRAMSPQGPGSSLGALILNETEDGLTLDLAAIGLPEGVAMATLAPRPECAAPEIWSAAKSQGAVDLGLGLRLTDPAEALARFAGQGEATEPEEAMPDFLVAAGGIAAVTAKAPSRSIAQMRGRAILLRPEGRPDAPPFACAVIP
ncbi:MAG: hypothetical protein VX463_11105, partial [Pseudomonadota bacterium]|nr:hypothetical protein [Pseudomonadota bacterium]